MARQERDIVAALRAAAQGIAQTATQYEQLFTELHAALASLETANTALSAQLKGAQSAAGGAGGRRVSKQSGAAARAASPRARGAAKLKGRATPTHVTPEVVRAVIAKLGQPTAAEIADEINRAERKVVTSGRAVRWLAQQAGAKTTEQEGRRTYRV